jgi:Glycosyltransferase family 10 (fucosyltransferase) C-term
MRIYFNAFWSGFFEKTNANHVDFFLDLCTKIFKTECTIGTLENSEILLETIYRDSVLKAKKWHYSILYSGESRIHPNTDEYTIVLHGMRNHKNIVNCPLFVSYLYCNNFTDRLKQPPVNNPVMPRNEVLAIISNPNGHVRNEFLQMLESTGIKITYAGHYRNNIGGNLQLEYKSQEFIDYVSQFKFIVSMENSREDTYITEKICHGLLANTIPVYWGSSRIADYFNKDRIFNLESGSREDMGPVIARMIECIQDDTKYNEIRSHPVYANNEHWRTIDEIAKDCRVLLETKDAFSPVNKIHFVCSPEFEPVRYEYLNSLIDKLKINRDKIKFLCPTYKHTITDEIVDKYVYTPYQIVFPGSPRKQIRKADLSLTLNYIANLKDIEKNFLDGVFCVLESDIDLLDTHTKIGDLFSSLSEKKGSWDLVHFGSTGEDAVQMWNPGYVEDLTRPGDKVRFERRWNTRSTDSLVISMEGVQKQITWFENNVDYCAPIDYLITQIVKSNSGFKFYWSDPAYLFQRSNKLLERSNIKDDNEQTL